MQFKYLLGKGMPADPDQSTIDEILIHTRAEGILMHSFHVYALCGRSLDGTADRFRCQRVIVWCPWERTHFHQVVRFWYAFRYLSLVWMKRWLWRIASQDPDSSQWLWKHSLHYDQVYPCESSLSVEMVWKRGDNCYKEVFYGDTDMTLHSED